MNTKSTILIFLIASFSFASCKNKSFVKTTTTNKTNNTIKNIVVGANKTSSYIHLLKNKRIGIVANQTSVIFKENNEYIHLVDSLLSLNINIEKVFAPEHGFRGKADAGEIIKDGIDVKTNLPIISLYGSHKKPTEEDLKDIDVIVFDIQDVGARFYTYISTLHYIMESCAEHNVELIVLDRPNPNIEIVDGPILETEYKSFVGMHPIPVLHGMTIGEYAQMINGEKWLKNEVNFNLKIIKCDNYTRQSSYSLPIKPSPNLPNDKSINLYPSLCFFEGTNFSVGRGTEMQFQIYGSPNYLRNEFSFIPKPNEGAKNPKYNSEKCLGIDLRKHSNLDKLDLSFLIDAYQNTSDKTKFFNSFFVKLAGTKKLQKQIEQGLSSEEISATWQKELDEFKLMRTKYLLY